MKQLLACVYQNNFIKQICLKVWYVCRQPFYQLFCKYDHNELYLKNHLKKQKNIQVF